MSNLTVTSYTSTGSTARSIDFTTGNIIVSNNAGGTLINMTATGLTVTGSSTGNGFTVTNTGATATTLTMPATNEANAINLLINAGSYALTLTGTSAVRNLDFTGFVGSVVNTAITIFLNLTLVTGMSAPAAGTNTWTFGATTTQTLTSAGKTLDYPITQNGVGGTLLLNDAFTMGSTRTFTLTNGTFDLNGFNTSVGAFVTAAGTKNLTFDGSTITITGSGTAWNNAAPAGFTVSAGTGSGTISLTSGTAKTFAGGSIDYGSTALVHNGAGTLTITGSNTFGSISTPITSTSAATLTLGAGTTQTVNSFTGTGQATRILTINSSTSYSTATINCTAGLSGYVTGIDYINTTDITFAPFANDGSDYIRWYVGSNSTAFNNTKGAIFQAYSAGISPKVYLVETGSTWTVPSDFNPSNNIVHLIGGGGGGARGSISNSRAGGGGGGGGGYTRVINFAGFQGTQINFSVGAGGITTTSGGSTIFAQYTAGGGGGGGLGSSWDRGAAGVGSTFNGGQGGFGYVRLDYNNSGAGGGGAGGPLGNGGQGGNSAFDNLQEASGGGGGGNGGGGNGSNGANVNSGGYPAGQGGNNASGVGGATNGGGGTRGGGGAGSWPGNNLTSRGSFGIDILNSFGSGGGSGGGGDTTGGVSGWGYGSGGSGSGSQTGSAAGGSGYQGVIIIQYVPATPPSGSSVGGFFLTY